MRSTVRSLLHAAVLASTTALLAAGCAPTDFFDEAGVTPSHAPAAATDAGGGSPDTASTPTSTAGAPAQNPQLAITGTSDARYVDSVLTSEIYAAEPTDPKNTMLVVKLTLESRSEKPQDLRAEFTLRVPEQPIITCYSDGKPGSDHPGLQGVTVKPGETREGWVYCEVPTKKDLRGARLAVRDDGTDLAQSLELTLPRG